MAFEVEEVGHGARPGVVRFDSLDAAKAYVIDAYEPLFFEGGPMRGALDLVTKSGSAIGPVRADGRGVEIRPEA